MRHLSCDVAIIGAGTAGLSARAAAHDAGATTLSIEAGPGGTTCARIGCMPSKLLVVAAGAAHAIRTAPLFGIETGPPRIDGAAVMARMRGERDYFVAGVLHGPHALSEAERVHGRARFLGPTRLAVDDHSEIEARAIVIATGSTSPIPEALKGVADRVLTNETVFELPTLPRSLAVIGAGPLGIELAQAFARLGVTVCVLDRGDAIAGLRDPKVGAVARKILEGEMALVPNATFTAQPAPGGVELSWDSPQGGPGRATFDYVLAAAGRTPNLDGLDLDKAGLALDPHGTPLYDRETMRCGDSAVFIAGDADHDRPVLHEAANEGRIAGFNAARLPVVVPSPRGVALSIVYTDPEIAAVGEPHDGTMLLGELDLRGSGRARVEGHNAGLIRIYARQADNVLVGGEMVGPGIEHIAHLLAWAVQLGLKAEELLALPFYHPTLEESLRGAARDLCKALKSGGVTAASLQFGPGA